MRTLQFTRALQQIVAKLKAKEIIEFLSPFLVTTQNPTVTPPQKDAFSILIVQSIAGFSQLESDPNIKKVLNLLKIADVYAAPRMGKLLGEFSVAQNGNSIWGHPQSYSLFYSFVDMLRWLESLSDGCTLLLETERIMRAPPGTQIIELEIVGGDQQGVEAERIEQFFSSLIKLHAQLARFLKIEDSHLEVIYIDSGSVLVGVAMAVGIAVSLHKLLKEIWQEIKYGPYERLNRKADSLIKVLTITKEIQAQIDSNALSEEDGKNLKLRIVGEALAIIEVGAMLPAEDATEEKEQTKLLTERRIKLLGSGDSTPVDNSDTKS